MPSKITTHLQVDDPVVIDSSYVFDATERRNIDDAIRGTQQHLVDAVLSGRHAVYVTLDSGSAAGAVGDVVCLKAGGNVTRAVAAAIGSEGAIFGILMTAASPGSSVLTATGGRIPPSITGLASSGGGFAKLNTTTARLERVSEIADGEYSAGVVTSDGYLNFGAGGSSAGGGGGGLLNIVDTDEDYTALATDDYIDVDASEAHITVDVDPNDFVVGQEVLIHVSGYYGVKLDAGTGNTINGKQTRRWYRPNSIVKLVKKSATEWQSDTQFVEDLVFYAEDYGIVGDDSTDNAAAWEAMMLVLSTIAKSSPSAIKWSGTDPAGAPYGFTVRVGAGFFRFSRKFNFIVDNTACGNNTNVRIVGAECGTSSYGQTVFRPTATPAASGSGANCSAAASEIVTVTGLSGMSAGMVGKYLYIASPAAGALPDPHHGAHLITEYVSATSVKVHNGNGTNGVTSSSKDWKVIDMFALMHTRDSTAENIYFFPISGSWSYSAVSMGQAVGPGNGASTNNKLINCVVNDNSAGGKIVNGVTVGDYNGNSEPYANGSGYPYNCDFGVLDHCYFANCLEAAVKIPNSTGQAKQWQLRNGTSISSCEFGVRMRAGSVRFLVGNISSCPYGIAAAQCTDSLELYALDSENLGVLLYAEGSQAASWPVLVSGGRYDTSQKAASDATRFGERVAFIAWPWGPLNLTNVQMSGSYDADFEILVGGPANPSLNAMGCSWPNLDPFTVASPGGYLTQIGCDGLDSGGNAVRLAPRIEEPMGVTTAKPSQIQNTPRRVTTALPEYTVGYKDQFLIPDTSDGEVVVTMQSLATTDERTPLLIKNKPSGLARVLVLGGTETIDGSDHVEVPPGQVCELLWTGTGNDYAITRPPVAATDPADVSPGDATGVIAWYEADSVTDIGGGRLSHLLDKENSFDLISPDSGNHALLVASMQNSLPGWRLVGSRPDFYEADGFDSLAGQDKIWIFAVFKNTQYGSVHTIAEITDDAGTAHQVSAINAYFGAGDMVMLHNSAQNISTNTDPTYDSRSKFSVFRAGLWTLDRSLSSLEGKLYINGQLQKSSRIGNSSGNFDNGRLRHGRMHDNVYPATVDMLCLAIGSGAIPAADIGGLYVYARDKWALAI